MEGKLEKALRLYAEHVGDFLVRSLKEAHGSGKRWVEAYGRSLKENRKEAYTESLRRGKLPEDAVDVAHFKDVLLGNRDVFGPLLGRSYHRLVTWADEILETRNKWAHQEELSDEEIYNTLNNISKALVAVGAEEAAAEVKSLRDGAKPAERAVAHTNESGWLGPWWQYAEPHPDIKRGEFDENTFAAKLDDVAAGRAGPEYLYADEFFKKTYLTKELRDLLADTAKRLAGLGGEAVVELRTPFGGGKTHTLIALYHLINDSATSGKLPEVQELLREVGLHDVPRARVAVLVGTALDPLGHSTDNGLEVRTLWGELAYQLGGADGYGFVADADKQRVAPGKERIIALLERYTPALILLDEVLLYLVKAAGVAVGAGSLQGQTFAFLQSLTEATGTVERVALLSTFPESHLEYMETDPDRVEAAFARLEKIFGRVEAVRVPVQKGEIYEVVRRRLFSHIDEDHAKRVAAAFHDHYRGLQDVPETVRSAEYRTLMERSFPFHPELVNLLYERWGTIQDFQKTRGVLQLLARVVEQSYRSPLARPFVGPGDIHLENPDLRAAVLKPLGRDARWESVVDTDILGKARELDLRIGEEYRRHWLAQSTATAIFMFSHSGGAKDGVTKPWLDISLTAPNGPSRALVSDALDRLEGELFYLYQNGAWVFRAEPNLNAVLNNILSQIEDNEVISRLREHVRTVVGKGALRPYVWPSDHKDIADDTALKLVVYGPEFADETEGSKRIRFVVQQNAPGGPRVYKNTLVHLFMSIDSKPGLQELVRRELALDALLRGSEMRLAEDQVREVEERLNNTRKAIPERVRSAYTELYDPYNSKGEFYYRSIRPIVQAANSLCSAVEEELRRSDRLLDRLDPGLITHGDPVLWPEGRDFLPLGELRGYFYRLPELPMLLGDEVLQSAIVRGVREGFFELAARDSDGYRLLYWGANVPGQVIFSDSYALVRPGVLPKPVQGVRAADTEAVPSSGTAASEDALSEAASDRTSRSVRVTKVSLRIPNLLSENLPVLVDIIEAFRDAGGSVNLSAKLIATNTTKGLDENVLSLTVRELLDQYGIVYEWDEEKA